MRKSRIAAVISALLLSCLNVSAVAGAAVHRPGRIAAPASWQVVHSPGIVNVNGSFDSGSCVTRTDCLAVGTYWINDSSMGLLAARWYRHRWSVLTAPAPAQWAQSQLTGVSCPTTTFCFAVGSYLAGGNAHPLLERWNGETLTPVSAAAAPAGEMDAISCLSAKFCVAVGSGPGAEKWNGTRWTAMRAPDGDSNAVTCVSQRFCAAVGSYSTGYNGEGTTGGTSAETWNGTRWRPEAPTNPRGVVDIEMGGVSCRSSTACIAVGGYYSEGAYGQLSYRWNGASWSKLPGTGFDELNGVACRTIRSCTAVGGIGEGLTAEHWNGTRWSGERPAPMLDDSAGAFSAISCAPQTTWCLSIGWIAASFGSGAATGPAAEVSRVSTWSALPTTGQRVPVSGALTAVSCGSAASCAAVGTSASPYGGDGIPIAERSTSHGWSQAALAAPGQQGGLVTGVSCPSATTCFAVGTTFPGHAPFVERWNGTRWSARTLPAPRGSADASINAISCTSPVACVAVGAYNGCCDVSQTLALVWNGTTWSISPSPQRSGTEGRSLTAVSCTTASACEAVGSADNSSGVSVAIADSWNGARWTVVAPPQPAGTTTSTLTGVSCAPGAGCTAVGSYRGASEPTESLAGYWNGSAWQAESPMVPAGAKSSELSAVSCSAGGSCEAVGDYLNAQGGTEALAMSDATSGIGGTWVLQSVPVPAGATSGQLTGLACVSAQCVAVGQDQQGQRGHTLVEDS
jgi:hypothetical protein